MLLAQSVFGQVHQVKLSQNLSALEINHLLVKAKVSLYGGQVLCWQPQREKNVFWLSKKAVFEQGKAIRGGIPLCWPWFGSHPDDSTAGNHGFAREQLWQVEKIDISEKGVEVSLIWQGEHISHLWPISCKLKQVLFFGQSFKQTLTMSNLSDQDAYFTGALHSYFAVSATKEVKVTALEQANFYDKLTEQLREAQPLENGVGPVDRIYYTNHAVTIVDNRWKRTIELKSFNAQQWVFWNPGAETANKMADVHLGGEQEFVCLEAANTEKQLLPAGKSVIMAQEIVISSHD